MSLGRLMERGELELPVHAAVTGASSEMSNSSNPHAVPQALKISLPNMDFFGGICHGDL